MGSRSKIVGINREKADSIDEIDEKAIALGGKDDVAEELVVGQEEAIEEEWEYDDALEPSPRNWGMTAAAALLLTGFIGWTGFFVWTNLSIISQLPVNSEIISLVGAWALPVAVLGILWLLIMRNSHAEASRFADSGEKLRRESEALELRMRTVNEEIALAREFLAQNARDLEAIGRQSAERLTLAAQQLGTALADSDDKAKKLEEVSNAAASNLEHLRKHLPVVTSAAKDVTNQIGSAGNGAQVQVKSLISALQRVNQAGIAARESVDGLEEDAVRAADHITESIGESSRSFSANMVEAEKSGAGISAQFEKITLDSNTALEAATTRLAELLGESGEALSQQLTAITANFETTTSQAQSLVAETSTELSGLLDSSSQKLSSQLADMGSAVENMRGTIETQDERIDIMVARISTLIEESMTHIEQLDMDATDKTAKLAFAIETLVQSTRDLDESIGQTNNSATGLVESSEKILTEFATAKNEIDVEIPAAIERLGENFASSFANMRDARELTGEMDTHSDNLLARLTTIDGLIQRQSSTLSNLMASSDEQLTCFGEQAQALSDSLEQTRDLVEEMAEDADKRLLPSLLQVRETTEETAARSKELIVEELSGVADRLSTQNSEMLSGAVDSQLAVLNEHMQGAIEKQLTLSQGATEKLTAQLAQINEMTANLETRLRDTHDSFGGLDHEGFARRMATLTETLNSTAIDVAKILSNDVTDTAWAAYLKGDRGVFTRRAVRLLDNGEARVIVEQYDEDAEFREHVNRYIHDFEAMMRVLLSTRDGNAIGVTLLSSDVGKLYVALAQAIERLRN
ncbi:MAG: hypothetical protein V3V15_07110 [Sphingorhabdus sp.]